MPSYRLYRLDRAGKIITAEWVEADDDASAEQHARDSGVPETLELWDRTRLVAKVEPRQN